MTKEKETKVEVTSLKLTIGDQKISLSLDEAKKLKAALDELFKTENHFHSHYNYDYWKYNFLDKAIGIGIPPRVTYGGTAAHASMDLGQAPKAYLSCDLNDYKP